VQKTIRNEENIAKRRLIRGITIGAVALVLLLLDLLGIFATQRSIGLALPEGMQITCIDTGQNDLSSVADSEVTRFAVIGDYGDNTRSEEDVAELVKSWNPEFIITTGDNNYPDGGADTVDDNIGQFYSAFIYPYEGKYTPSERTTVNRFFPTLGNHDWLTAKAQPYLDYFALPGNERYYDFVWGPIHFFALDSDSKEPDGNTQDSIQALWLRDKLASSTATWKIVYMHHPPHSSGKHGSSAERQWPFREWGATAVIAGHDHTYERILKDGFPYFVNGLGGMSEHLFAGKVPGSQVQYRADYGAMLVEANDERIVFKSYTRTGCLIDVYGLSAAPAE